jgi:hypothetical protein
VSSADACVEVLDEKLKASPSWKAPAARAQSRATTESRAGGPAPRRRREQREISLAVNRSELDHRQTGDSLEIAEVQSRDFVA